MLSVIMVNVIMLNIENQPFTLSVIMLNVVMLSVMAPYVTFDFAECHFA